MRKFSIFVVILLFYVFNEKTQSQFFDARGKAQDASALSVLEAVKTSMEMHAADNGTYPQGIATVTDLVAALGDDYPPGISTDVSNTGSLIAAATNEQGNEYRIYAVGRDGYHCYGLAQNGTKVGPDTLSNVVKALGKPFPKDVSEIEIKIGDGGIEKKEIESKVGKALKEVKTAMQIYAADNGAYPKGINSVDGLVKTLGENFPSDVNIKGTSPGTLAAAATSDKGVVYRIYVIGQDESQYYGLAEDGTTFGPDTLSNVVKALGEPFPKDVLKIESTLVIESTLDEVKPENLSARITKGEEVYNKDISFYKKGGIGVFKITFLSEEINGHTPNSLTTIYEGNNLFAVYGLDTRADMRSQMFRGSRIDSKQLESFPEYKEKNDEFQKIKKELKQANSNLRQSQRERQSLKKQIEKIKKENPPSKEKLAQAEERLKKLDKQNEDYNSTLMVQSKRRVELREELKGVKNDLLERVLKKQPAYVIFGRFKSAGEAILNINSRISGETFLKINFELPDSEAGNSEVVDEWKGVQESYMVKLLSVTPGDSIFSYIVNQSILRVNTEETKKQKANTRNRSGGEPRRDGQNVNLYSITTGALAIQESLQLDRIITSSGKVSPQEVSIEKLTGPNIKSHPFAEMLEGRKPQFMDMASLVPDDFYYFHFSDINKEIEFSDLLDQWGTSLLNVMQVSSQDSQIKEKYLTQLCIELSLLTRLFGDEVIDDLAIAGSDPFLHEGTDISVIFNVKNKVLFNASMSKYITDAKEKFSDVEESEITYGNYSIHAVVTPDRTVSSYSCYIDNFRVYSNSRKAIERIIDTYDKKQASLADAADFLYMRTIFAGDKSHEDAFLYLSENNIRKLVGPQWKIARKRRMECINSLRIINNAITLYYMENNTESPAVENLLAGRYLEQDYLLCPDGGSYKLFPEGPEPYCSKHGRLRYFTPIIELPVKMVSVEEEKEYRNFVTGYNSFWSKYFDPVGIRIKFDDETIKVETCILPLIENSIYNGFKLLAGGDPVTINSPGAEGTIFQFFTKFNLNEEYLSDPRFIDQFLGKTSFTRKQFIDMLGDGIGINFMDGDMIFSFDLTRGGGLLGNFSRNRSLMLAGSFLVSSLNLPTYLTLSVKDEEMASQFIHEILQFLADENANSRKRRRNSEVSVYTYQVSPAYKGHKIETLDMELFVVRLRLHFMVFKNHLIIANQREVLTKIIDNPLEFTDKEANLMLNVRSGAFDRIAKIVKLGWQERMRKVCVNNLGSVYALHRYRRMPFDQINNTSLKVNGYYPYCPSNGEYIYDKNRDSVDCSIHGDILSPKQPFDIDPEVPLNKFIASLKNIETSLNFTPEGIMTSLTIKREGKK